MKIQKCMAIAGILVLCLCSYGKSSDKASSTDSASTLKSGIRTSNFDNSVRAADDLYRHVSGTWMKNSEIPADKSTYGISTILYDESLDQLKAIIEDAAASKDAKPGTEAQQVGDFYKSYMNEEKLEKLGLEPIQGYIAEVNSIQDKSGLVAWMARMQRVGVRGPIRFFIDQDEKMATQYISYFYQGGLGLPDRDYYFKDDEKSKGLRDAYVKHVQAMFELAGIDDPAGSAARIYAIEEKIAKGHFTRVENRDPQKTYNKYEISKLNTLTDAIDWEAFTDGLGISGQTNVIVAQPSHITNLGEVWSQTSLDDWKLYAKWRILTEAAPFLSKAIDDEDFNFYGKTLRGIQEQEPRWKRAVQAVDDMIGEAVGKIYVQKYFPPEAKARMQQLVKNLLAAYEQSIESLDWMTPDTKKAAKAKLVKFTYKIGYPDKWRDYSKLQIEPGDLMGNVVRAGEFEYNRNLDKLGKPIDRTEWGMTPQTINAYYNPVMNEIVFPAAILQPPFFDMKADDAVNYGAIGGVIGHEIGHGFDDSGSQYDGDGNLRNWWTDQDRKEFEARTEKLVAQYNSFEPLPGEHVNGKLTLGENIGDLGGLTIAYKAYKISLHGKEAPVIDGFTGDQRFFFGWAQVWARLYRDEELSRRLNIDPHSPSEYRCNGVLRNVPEFYTAFDVKEGDRLYLKPEDRVKIW